jgi:hypothetical protein
MIMITHANNTRKYAALLMLLVVLKIVGGVYPPQGERYGLTKDRPAAAEVCTFDNYSPAGSHEDHKPPKHSFTDYDSLFTPSCGLPDYAPPTASQPFHDRPVAIPDVYHDIYVPPQNHA